MVLVDHNIKSTWQLTLFIDDLSARVPDDVLGLRLAVGRYVYRPLHDDGGAVHIRPVGQAFIINHVGQPQSDLCLVAVVPNKASHVDLATFFMLAGRPFCHLGVAAERQHCSLKCHTWIHGYETISEVIHA